MAGLNHCRGLLAAIICTCAFMLLPLTARAGESIPRYSFKLACEHPLLASRWQQPEHAVYGAIASFEDWQAAHPDSAADAELRLNFMNREGAADGGMAFAAYMLLAYRDPALEAALHDWVLSLPGIDADSIRLEEVDADFAFEQHPACEFIINGEHYRYPQDFTEPERDWFAMLASTNYPNQTMFIPLPDEELLGRFGFSRLLRADTSGQGEPIVVNNFSDVLDTQGLAIPRGMGLCFTFIPSHLVPAAEDVPALVLSDLQSTVRNYTDSAHLNADYWRQIDYELTALPADSAKRLLEAASAEFMDWLAQFPQLEAGGMHFGDCTLEPVRADGRPVQLSLRLSSIDQYDAWKLKERIAALGLEPLRDFRNVTQQCMYYNDAAELADPGVLLRSDSADELPLAAVQQAVDSYLERRRAMLPPPAGFSASAEEMPEDSIFKGIRLKLEAPSVPEYSHLQSWVALQQPGLPQWQSLDWLQSASGKGHAEAVSGVIELNGTRYRYPEDFAGVDARQLEDQLGYSLGQRTLAIFSGISYQPPDDPALTEQFAYGDLAMLERTEEGLSITTLAEHWDHGVDISALNIPGGIQPRLQLSLPLWYGNDPQEIREFARHALAGYRVMRYPEDMQQQQPVSYRQIIANPVPQTEQQVVGIQNLPESTSAADRLATLQATKLAYSVVRDWLAETKGASPDDVELDVTGSLSRSAVTFHANEMQGMVQQIQIGVRDATDEQLVELMNRIYLATGITDIWAMGGLYPSLLLDDPEKVNAAARPMTVTTVSD